MFEIGIIRILDRPFNFYKYIVFPTDAEYSFFFHRFQAENIVVNILKSYDIAVLESIQCLDTSTSNFGISPQASEHRTFGYCCSFCSLGSFAVYRITWVPKGFFVLGANPLSSVEHHNRGLAPH